ncbi:uncharacterized protein LOC134539593 [Bacillus rossius redtenbacheri]|uniref:uncharacterized protein LOC134539593 n=1 Tax=Bacillus rossius redtenbacheri TaxID=93214 RepID=UPI002FDDD4AA
MLSCAAVLLLAAFTAAEGFTQPRSTFSVDADGYIEALLTAAGDAIKAGNVSVTYKEYVVEFRHKKHSYVLELPQIGLSSSFPVVSVHGDVLWWGDSSVFHVYADALLGNHTVYYKGRVGVPGNLTSITINITKTDYTMSTYKKFVQSGSAYDLKVHILDAKRFGHQHYNISIPNGSEDLVKRVRHVIEEYNLKRNRDYSLTALTDYVLAVMDDVDIGKFVTSG